MNDASYKYSGVVGNMDAKSPKNAVDGWMNDGLPKYYSGMNDGSQKICSGWMVGEFTLGFIIKEIISCVLISFLL
jgi:hypothetical protein